MMMFLGGLPDSLNLQVAAEEALCANPKKAGLCNHQHLLPALYREALSRARRDQKNHHFLSSSEHHIGPPIDYSTDAIIYVTVVVIFYFIIIVLLLIPKRSSSRPRATSSENPSTTGGSSMRKHWLFFNPISGEAQQASRKESAHFIHRQDAETV